MWVVLNAIFNIFIVPIISECDQMKMVEGKAAEQEVDYEFFKAGVDGRKEGEVGTDKRFGEIQFFLTHPHSH